MKSRKEIQEWLLKEVDDIIEKKDENSIMFQAPALGKCQWTLKEYRHAVETDTCLENTSINPIDDVISYVKYCKERYNVDPTEHNSEGLMSDIEYTRIVTNKEKFVIAQTIRLKDIIDYLDGALISCKLTEQNLDHIDNRYCSKEISYRIFKKDDYSKVCFSNKWYIDPEKPFCEELKKVTEYTLSKNAIRKCNTKDDIIKMYIKKFSGYLHFKIGIPYTYINIQKILCEEVNSSKLYSSDKSRVLQEVYKEICDVTSQINSLYNKLKILKRREQKLEFHQKIHDILK